MLSRVQVELCVCVCISGDIEFLLKLKTHSQSAVSTQVCQLYALDLKNYERLVARRNRKTIEMIREQAQVKLMSRVQRMQSGGNKVPLLKTLLCQIEAGAEQQIKRKPRKSSPFSSNVMGFESHRGPLVDLYGPGTVFYRNRQREKARTRKENRHNHFRGELSPNIFWMDSESDKNTPNGRFCCFQERRVSSE